MAYEIKVLTAGADMEKVREVCADLLAYDPAGEEDEDTILVQWGVVPEDEDTILVQWEMVPAAVQRINALGFATDEDDPDDWEPGAPPGDRWYRPVRN